MERLLLLWDEMDDVLGIGRHFVAGAISEVARAAGLGAAQLAGWSAAAGARLAVRQTDQP